MLKKTIILLLVLFTAASLFAASTKRSLAALKAEDYYGKAVDAEIFKPYDVTMVNIFTTWCTYCLREMADIKMIRSDLPENANVISICADAYEAPQELKEIVEFFQLDFPILKMTSDQLKQFYSVIGYPTTLFVGSDGTILDVQVGVPKYGAYIGYTNKINKLLGISK